MSDQFIDGYNEDAIAMQAEQIIKDALDRTTDAWTKISKMIPEYWFCAMNGAIYDRITLYTDPVLFAQSVQELALYIELTGHVPADPEIFFDFGGE